jgi:hypothetical protein
MFFVPFLICGAPTPSGPLAIESKIPDAAVLQNSLPASTCILRLVQIEAILGRSFCGAGSAEIPRLLRCHRWRTLQTFLPLTAEKTGQSLYQGSKARESARGS